MSPDFKRFAFWSLIFTSIHFLFLTLVYGQDLPPFEKLMFANHPDLGELVWINLPFSISRYWSLIISPLTVTFLIMGSGIKWQRHQRTNYVLLTIIGFGFCVEFLQFGAIYFAILGILTGYMSQAMRALLVGFYFCALTALVFIVFPTLTLGFVVWGIAHTSLIVGIFCGMFLRKFYKRKPPAIIVIKLR